MTKVRRFFSTTDIRIFPMYYVELILGVFAVLGGILLLLPGFISIDKPEYFLRVFDIIGSNPGIIALGTLALLSGLLTLIGLVNNNLRLRLVGMFMQFVIRLYATIGVILVYGLYPTTWVSSVALTLIAAVVWLTLKGERRGT